MPHATKELPTSRPTTTAFGAFSTALDRKMATNIKEQTAASTLTDERVIIIETLICHMPLKVTVCVTAYVRICIFFFSSHNIYLLFFRIP